MKRNLPPDFFVRLLIRPFIELKKLYHLYIKRFWDFNKERFFDSKDLKIDVLISTVEKDLDVLAFTIAAIRENVKHNMCNFIIVAPENPNVEKFCMDNNYKFISEDRVLPIKKSDIKYVVNGIDRSGWILQQFIKYSESLSTQEYYLTVDTDTILIRPQSYMRNGRILLLDGNDFFPAYARMSKKLFGYTSYWALPMVCHQNFFSKTAVRDLKKEIENRSGKKWYEAILDNMESEKNRVVFAENYTYAFWMLHNHAKDVDVEFFYNKKIDKSEFSKLASLKQKYRNKYKSLSFQVYVN